MTSHAPTRSPTRGAPAALWAASATVLAASALAAFRMGFAEDVPTLVHINGPRVLLGAAAGAAFALAGAIRLQLGREGALRGLAILAISAGAAAGGFAGAELVGEGALAVPAFGLGALAGVALGLDAARLVDRPARWTNLAAAGLLAAGIGLAALAGSYARARVDFVAPVVAWLLGDLSGATLASGLVLLTVAAAMVVAALRSGGDEGRLGTLALLAFGLGIGVAGLVAFVGSMVPRTVRALARDASPGALLATSAVAGAATVAAIDAVPRLLVGGYDFPFNVPAGIVAIPFFLAWNRARLRREAGPAHPAFEALELTLIAGMTLAAAYLAVFLAQVIAIAT